MSKGDQRRAKAKELRDQYHEVLKAREEYESSLAPPAEKKPPRKKVQPVTVRKGDRSWVEPTYEDYISSAGWEKRRADYFAGHARKCFACGARDKIQLHHKTYARMGRELDEDLMPLCERCHSEVHRIQRTSGRNLAEVTDQFAKKGWLAQKQRKSRRQRGVNASAQKETKAKLKKASQVPDHRDNPVEYIIRDVPKKAKSGPVTVRKAGTPRPERSEPSWVGKAQGAKRKRKA